jgi:hypothetical protein
VLARLLVGNQICNCGRGMLSRDVRGSHFFVRLKRACIYAIAFFMCNGVESCLLPILQLVWRRTAEGHCHRWGDHDARLGAVVECTGQCFAAGPLAVTVLAHTSPAASLQPNMRIEINLSFAATKPIRHHANNIFELWLLARI